MDPKRVLVVDDDASVRELIVRSLAPRYTMYEAADGRAALEMLDRIPKLDAIFYDVMMPRLDGINLTRFVKRQRATQDIPIILLTAKDGFDDIVNGINAGARHYIRKPFKVADLRSRMEKILK